MVPDRPAIKGYRRQRTLVCAGPNRYLITSTFANSLQTTPGQPPRPSLARVHTPAFTSGQNHRQVAVPLAALSRASHTDCCIMQQLLRSPRDCGPPTPNMPVAGRPAKEEAPREARRLSGGRDASASRVGRLMVGSTPLGRERLTAEYPADTAGIIGCPVGTSNPGKSPAGEIVAAGLEFPH